MTTGSTPALNEPKWLQIARKHQVQIAEEDIPPPGDGAEWVSDVLEAAGVRDHERNSAQAFLAWGRGVDTTRQVPGPGTIVVIANTGMWRPAKRSPGVAARGVGAPMHVGFLAGSTSELIYVMGEGVIRAFPRTAVSSIMNGDRKTYQGYRWPL